MSSDLPFLDQHSRRAAVKTARSRARSRLRQQKYSPVRTRRRALLLLASVLVCSTAAALFTSPALCIRTVSLRIDGISLTPEQSEAVAIAKTAERTNLLRAPAAALQSKISRLPWVREATVRRAWPNTLTVAVKARTPIALLETTNGFVEIDAERYPIRAASADSILPRIKIEGTTDCRLGASVDTPEAASAALAALEAGGSSPLPIQSIRIDADQKVWLTMSEGVEVRIGHQMGLPERLTLLRRIYQSDPKIAEKVARINLVSDEYPAVTPRRGASARFSGITQSPNRPLP
jgi:cell division protein FtsQ